MDPATGAALINAGGSLLGGLFGGSSAKKAAAAQMAFQREVLQNQHQWEVADLRAAGLNPILSAGGSGPGGASGAMDMSGQMIQQGISGAAEAARSRLEMKALEQQINLGKANEVAAIADAGLKNSNARAVEATTAKAQAIQPLWDTVGNAINSAKAALTSRTPAPSGSAVALARKPNHPLYKRP